MKLISYALALTGAVLLGAGPARAASHYIVIPSTGKAAETPADPITVSLSGSLPAGMVGQAYAFDMATLLSITGDPSLDLSLAAWSANNPLPPGLSLDGAGMLTGTPTTKNEAGTSFEVLASYKGETGQQVYTIVVNGAVLQVTQISVGWLRHACAITVSGGVKCWGMNNQGQLGNGTSGDFQVSPVDVQGLSGSVASIQAGSQYTCALMTSGGVKCWGANYYGQLGNGTTSGSTTPVDVSGLGAGVASLSTGEAHACAVTTAGAVKCWGRNYYGQLGDNTQYNNRTSPVAVVGMSSGISRVSAGDGFTCAVTTAGAAKCWGLGNDGQLGNSNYSTLLAPQPVFGLSAGVASLTTGSHHACAITTAGGARCWGRNAYGQLGDGTSSSRNVPVAVSGLSSGVQHISAGFGHTCAIVAGGAKCWGFVGAGQLGNGSRSGDQKVPVDVVGLSANVVALDVGRDTSCAVLSGGATKCWGDNSSGVLGVGDAALARSALPMDVMP